MDPTSLYYTFTTIAQALAGAFGVLAAFAVLALSRIQNDIGNAQNVVLNLKSPYEPAWKAFREHGLDEFLKRELPNTELGSNSPELYVLRRGEAALQAQSDLRRRMIVAAVPTAIAVGISIVAIPLVPTLACSALWSVIVAAIAVTLAIVCLVFYGRVVVSAIR